jgi:erythronate-4-phosphate dehydrogenase
MPIQILADSAMPYWQEFFLAVGEVKTFKAGELSAEILALPSSAQLRAYLPYVECLLVRSTTQVNQALLRLMPNLQFVATATAGFDHFDIDALHAAGIAWYAAGGCNAQAVAQYVVCAALQLAVDDRFLLQDKRVAIVGHGNVGSRVASALHALGAQVIIYDPPQLTKAQCETQRETQYETQRETNRETHSKAQNATDLGTSGSLSSPCYVSFSEVLKADIICIHAPLNSHSEHPSRHLFDADALSQLNGSQYLINAGRGEIIDNQDLLSYFENAVKSEKAKLNVVLDVWENEPTITTDLVGHLRIASAHIAGHTLEGKANGTFMLYQQLCRRYNMAQKLKLSAMLPPDNTSLPKHLQSELHLNEMFDGESAQRLLKNICHLVYDIQNDDRVFRAHMAQFNSFAKLRQEYPIRREFSALRLNVKNTNISQMLRGIGFVISNDGTT